MAISVSAMASVVLLVAFTAFLVGPSLCNVQIGGIVGGRSDIPNVKSDKKVQDLGKWCVDEHNTEQHASLTFGQVLAGQRQVVEGTNYYLRIQAVDGGVAKLYDAVVWVREWLGSKELTSFKPAA